MMLKIFMIVLLTAATGVGQVPPSQQAPAQLEGVGIDQKLNQQVPLDLTFRDETGRAVRLGDYFQEKPVVLVLAYYECPMLCTLVLNGLLRGMNPLRFTAGREFKVVTVSIDPGEGSELARLKKQEYLRLYERHEADQGWHFLTGAQESIDALAQSVGFRYKYDAETDLYLHASGIMILTPSGKLSRYLYGIDYSPRDLRLGLVEASAEEIASPVDQLLLYCFSYDPEMGKYTLVVMNIVRLAAVATLLLMATCIALNIRRDRRKGLATETLSTQCPDS